ncbi:MAG: MATE family efflux transporter, partial [candidate division Zixibacteria bacterium]|nr:MATE family efflux transporter [candidate division Zixibacteria bacterium]
MHRESATTRQLYRDIWILAWPIAAANFLSRGAAIVDTAMVGHLSSVALAGLGIAQIPVFLAMAVQRGLGIGGQVLIAYHTGAEEPERRFKVARAVVALSTLVSLGLSVLLWLIAPTLCRLMGADDAMLAQALRFLGVYYLIQPFSGAFFVFSCIFQGVGDAKTPLYVTLGVNMLHVLTAYATIFGHFGFPRLGVAGSAIGLGFSELTGAVILAVIAQRRRLWAANLKNLSLRAALAVWRLGGPAVGERLLVSGMQGVYYRFLTGFGTAAMAAHRIGIDMEATSFLPAMGFGQAATTLVGQHLGAGDPKTARRAGWMTTQIAMVFMGALALSFYFFADGWMHLFTTDTEVIALGKRFCAVAAAIQLPLAFAIVLAGALRGAGETRWVMMTPFVGGWLVRLPLSYLLGYTWGYGLMGVWWTMMADWMLRCVLITFKFKYLKFRLGDKVTTPP